MSKKPVKKKPVKKKPDSTLPDCEKSYLIELLRKRHGLKHEYMNLEVKNLGGRWDIFVYTLEQYGSTGRHGIHEYLIDYFSFKKKELSRLYALAQLEG